MTPDSGQHAAGRVVEQTKLGRITVSAGARLHSTAVGESQMVMLLLLQRLPDIL